MRKKRVIGVAASAVTVGAVVALLATTALATPGSNQGASSTQDPFLLRDRPGVVTTSLLTAGDSVGGYRMTGIPDGLGAFDNGDGTFTVLMNHEVPGGAGAVRAHGANGAFVSKWIIDKDTLAVLHGEDLIQRVYGWSGSAWTQIPAGSPQLTLSRLCSADLPAVAAYYDTASGLGTRERIFMNGEESGNEGRGFATVVTGADAGSAYHIPWLGRFSYENAVAKPDAGVSTVVVGLDDSTPGQVYVYVGSKQSSGNDVEKAGLADGVLYGLKIDGVATENDATTLPGGSARFSLVPLGDVSGLTGAALQSLSLGLGVSNMARPEDGSWDPSDAHNFYFNTTASFGGLSRIWKLRFDDPANVAVGGSATIAVQGPAFDPAKPDAAQAGPRMLDNLTVNDRGQVISLEDVGNNAYLGGVYQFDPSTGSLARIARHDPAHFVAGAPGFITQDEEASGVIPVTFLGEGMYLIDTQVHKSNPDPALFESGQLLLMQIPPGRPV